jgi:hypothetical protein
MRRTRLVTGGLNWRPRRLVTQVCTAHGAVAMGHLLQDSDAPGAPRPIRLIPMLINFIRCAGVTSASCALQPCAAALRCHCVCLCAREGEAVVSTRAAPLLVAIRRRFVPSSRACDRCYTIFAPLKCIHTCDVYFNLSHNRNCRHEVDTWELRRDLRPHAAGARPNTGGPYEGPPQEAAAALIRECFHLLRRLVPCTTRPLREQLVSLATAALAPVQAHSLPVLLRPRPSVIAHGEC